LPNKYWGEAVNTANYLQNILPTSGEVKTPHEKWEDEKPKMNPVVQVGPQAYAIIPPDRRQKHDHKARKLTFVGYAEGTKGYRLLDTVTDRICISWDVNFVEGDPYSCTSATASLKNNEQQQATEDSESEVNWDHHQNSKTLNKIRLRQKQN
jgi:hypothetical protein